MRLYGLELLRGLTITLGHFIASYTVGIRRRFSRAPAGDPIAAQRREGIFTVQYPEEQKPIPERFRVLPVLIFDGKEGERWSENTERCTACGICAKVCPPQCIWIEQAKSAEGKPVPKAGNFYIDADVCMNCGLCAEFCPFDAIKMDHNFELSVTERTNTNLFDINRLHVSTEYYARTHPVAWGEEQARKEAEAQRRAAAKKATP
ncbi:MAG: 4Fe-4S ferredoxin [Candidatus Omnitrophica bacterium CG11_big_fil_rev_8_21_14_0_20_64_10]|nr:MAG: 4Fe-4S ferredoxin [Candidatus Omnitrophica bacterium CG11_big_fil_rev_8_21_14_0_20_64_10]